MGIFLVSLPLFAGNRSRVIATKVNIFKPQGEALKIEKGFCWTGSLAISRDDAWRCMVRSNIFDPCFVVEALGRILCDANPIENKSC